jgi:RHS repeat-associated protein
LVEVKTSAGASQGRYLYDAENRRVLKITPSATTRYLYRGWEEIEERNGSNTPIQQYVYRSGRGLDRPVQFKKLSGTNVGTYYYHDDPRGNIGALTDSTQAVRYHTEYDSWGDGSLGGSTLVSPTDPNAFLASEPLGNPLLWQARRLDTESGLYHYRHRYYNARQGRFVQADPPGSWHDPGNLGNRYAFGSNQPGAWDPLGLKEQPYNPSVHKPFNTLEGTATRVPLMENIDTGERRVAPGFEGIPYNCHSYSLHDKKGDPSDPDNGGNTPPNWDNYVLDDDLPEDKKLDQDDPNVPGDIVVYGEDTNGNGQLDRGEERHTAVVIEVDGAGNTTYVEGKQGFSEITQHHPANADPTGNYGNVREYFSDPGGYTAIAK